MSYTIEKDVPMAVYSGKWAELTEEMQVGDSVLMSLQEMKSFREHMRRKGILTLVRNMKGNEPEEAYRIWRRG